jgi:hypothetical protein
VKIDYHPSYDTTTLSVLIDRYPLPLHIFVILQLSEEGMGMSPKNEVDVGRTLNHIEVVLTTIALPPKV